MLCVALRKHFQTVSPIRASLCSLGLSVRISKLSKIVNAALTPGVHETINSSSNREFAMALG